MSTFRNKTINGQTYDLSHLEPFNFPLHVGNNRYGVRVQFNSHVFTEKFDETIHTLDLRYTHGNELRAFNIRRHELSLALPKFIETHGNRSVYHDDRGSYFILRSVGSGPADAPYAIFISASPYERNGADVLIRVRSAYEKQGMTKWAKPIKFTNLVEAKATNQTLTFGPSAKIRRR